jgi:hypothetical protein
MARTKIQISVTPVTPVTPDFLKVSRVLRTRIMRTGVTRTHLHGTREKFTHYSVTGVIMAGVMDVIYLYLGLDHQEVKCQ